MNYVTPALEAFLKRIGAEQLNFRRYIVKQHRGAYYTEVATISVNRQGLVRASDPEYAPTEEEAEAILKEFEAGAPKWPQHIRVKATQQRPKAIDRASSFEFYDQRTGELIMIQSRIQQEDGSKAYVPWTFWDDGEWRPMEPEGRLPFWKPDKEMAARIMIHEGAKAAAAAQDLAHNPKRAADRENHPWGEFLSQFEHWGMIGGALAPHRADWDEVKARKPVEVIYFCDADEAGAMALQGASRAYRRSLAGIRLEGRQWPNGWDMADPLPEALFKKGVWIGPRLEDCLVFATWATKKMPNPEGKGSPVSVLTDEFRKEWAHVAQPEAFVNIRWPSHIYSAKEFNHLVAPFSDLDDTARLVRRELAKLGRSLAYYPHEEPGVCEVEEGWPVINTHIPSPIKAAKDAGPEDWKRLDEYFRVVFPIETDREHVKRWCATLIARPAIKMSYGLLVISHVQGVGKTTLGERILAPLMGKNNVSYPSEADITKTDFNEWAAHKRLAVVNEIYAGHSAKAYNDLKSIVTDAKITINRKFMGQYRIDNWLHIYASSNSERALQLSSGDRRWLVPEVTESVAPKAFWQDLIDWLSLGGLPIVKAWAEAYVEEFGPVLPGDWAPETERKMEIINEGKSAGQMLVASVLEELNRKYANQDVILLDRLLQSLVVNVLHDGRTPPILEKPLTLRKVAEELGWHTVRGKPAQGREWLVNGMPPRLLVRKRATADFGTGTVVQMDLPRVTLEEMTDLIAM